MVIAISFLVLELLIVALGVWLGYRRSTGRSLVRLVYLIVIGGLSLLVSRLVAGPISSAFWNLIHNNFVGEVAAILDASPNLDVLLIGFIGALCVPIVFSLVFAVLQALSMICLKRLSTAIVSKITGSGEEPTKKNRAIGAAIGAVSALVVVMGLFAPISMVETISAQISEDAVVVAEHLSAPAPSTLLNVVPHVATDAARAFGKLPSVLRIFDYTNLLTLDTTPGGVSYSAAKEAGVIGNAALVVFDELKNEDAGTTDEDAIAMIGRVATVALGELSGSDMSREIMVDLVCGVGITLQNGGSIGGVDTSHGSKVQNVLMKGVANTLAKTTKDNLAANMKTFVGIDLDAVSTTGGNSSGDAQGEEQVDVKSEAGAIQYLAKADITNAQDILKDNEKCENLIDAIYTVSENPEMTDMMDAISEAGNELLSGDDNPLKDLDENTVSSFQDTLNNTLKIEAGKEESSSLKDKADTLKNTIVSTAKDNNIEIDEKQAELGAICVATEFLSQEMIDAYLNDPNFSISYDEIAAYLGIQ